MVDPETIQALRAGDQSAVQLVIVAYIPLAMQLAYYAARKAPWAKDDLISTALYTLVHSVHRAVEGLRDDNIKPYLITRIKYGLMKYPKKHQPLPHAVKARKGVSYEMLDMICKSASSVEDLKVLTLRSKGYNDKEIAEILGTYAMNVSRIRKQCFQRFKELEKDAGIHQHRRNTIRRGLCRPKRPCEDAT